jgi:hypothetical protein
MKHLASLEVYDVQGLHRSLARGAPREEAARH